MPAWLLPFIMQAGEALFFGVGTAFVLHQSGSTWSAALLGAGAAMLGKVAPKQILKTG